jgi:Tol biopolymer transport system component
MHGSTLVMMIRQRISGDNATVERLFFLAALDVAVVDFTPKDSGYASNVTQVLRNDLDYSLYFRVAQIDSFVRAILGDDMYNMDGWYQLGVQYLVDGSVQLEEGKLKAEINVADVLRKKVIKSFRFETKAESYRALAHAIADELVLQFTGLHLLQAT